MGTLKFLGRGSAFNVKEGNTSAFLTKDKSILIIDCGENIFERIRNKSIIENIDEIFVLITHLHPDHVGSLGSLIFYCYYMKDIKINIFYEDTYNLMRLLRLQGSSNSQYNIYSSKDVIDLTKLGIKELKPIVTEHTPEIESFGYIIDFFDGKEILYLGDTNNICNEIIEEIKRGCYSEIYVDTCLKDFKNNPHLSINRLCELIPRSHRSNIYSIHYDSDDLIPRIIEEGFKIVENI